CVLHYPIFLRRDCERRHNERRGDDSNCQCLMHRSVSYGFSPLSPKPLRRHRSSWHALCYMNPCVMRSVSIRVASPARLGASLRTIRGDRWLVLLLRFVGGFLSEVLLNRFWAARRYLRGRNQSSRREQSDRHNSKCNTRPHLRPLYL